jgi:hypothetical protein
MAAFAKRTNTPTGQRHLQQIHDMTVERGAQCSSGKATMASRHESTAIQAIHDLASEHGALCEGQNDTVRGDVPAMPLLYSAEPSKKENKRMNWKDMFAGMFGALEEREHGNDLTPPTPAAPMTGHTTQPPLPGQPTFSSTGTGTANISGFVSTVPSPAPDPRVAELEKQVAEAHATIAREAEARIQREAALFAEEQVRAQKATPAELEKLAAAFAQAMRDDQRHESVTFTGADGQEQKTSRVQQLRDVYEARPAGLLQNALLPDGQNGQGAAAIFNKQETERVGPDGKKVDGGLSAERRRALLEGSSLGRAIVRDEGKAPHNGHTPAR